MANSFGSLYIGASGLKTSQTALNVTANNLANIHTTGYVRETALHYDKEYVSLGKSAAVSKMTTGIGVQIGDVAHTRNIFLDQSYRQTVSEEGFYSTLYEASAEVETYLQELEGVAFQDSLENLWTAFEQFSITPDDAATRTLIIQYADLFLTRANAVYASLQDYQYNLNSQIEDTVNTINSIGEQINDLNRQIQRIEAGGVETAMTLRDERDVLLDELASYVDIDYSENYDGVVTVSIDGVEFVTETKCYEMSLETDRSTGFVTPYWQQLSNMTTGELYYVYNLTDDISAEKGNDTGSLKALLLARGDKMADYTDVSGVSADEYNNGAGLSVIETIEAQLDQLVYAIVTGVNDLLCPNMEASNISTLSDALAASSDGTVTLYDADGNAYTVTAGTKFLDVNNCSTGTDGKIPPEELFVRAGVSRYTEVTDEDGNTYYLYTEEEQYDEDGNALMGYSYAMANISINSELVNDQSKLAHLTQNGAVDYDLAASLAALWTDAKLTLNPNNGCLMTFKEYYQNMVDELATTTNVYESMSSTLETSALSIDNQRQNVIGVSADEELEYMIKYQNAYNASSRFINVINDMIQTLLSMAG